MWWKTEFLQPRSQKKSHIDALWVEMIRNRRVEYSVICWSASSFARITHSFACYALVALLTRSAARIRSLRCAHSLAPLRSFARSAALIRSLRSFARSAALYSLEHTLCRVCSLRSSIWRKKMVFDFFFFFAFASMEVPLEDRQRRVRFKGQVYGNFFLFFVLLLFNG